MKFPSGHNAAYDGVRHDLIGMAGSLGGRRILDVGCYRGINAKFIKKNFVDVHYTGIEIDEFALATAHSEVDKILKLDLDSFDASQMAQQTFDVVFLGDVLEHLKDPGGFLQKLAPCLASNGVVLVSVPNIQYYETFVLLLFGRFPRRRRGIFDQSHLRFFTKKEFELCVRDTYTIDAFRRNYRLVEGEYWSGLNRYTRFFLPLLRVFAPFFTFQLFFKLKRKSP